MRYDVCTAIRFTCVECHRSAVVPAILRTTYDVRHDVCTTIPRTIYILFTIVGGFMISPGIYFEDIGQWIF